MDRTENREKREWPDSMDAVDWEVEPMAGWKPDASNGLLRHGPGDECRLVRLVDLAAWLGDQYPRDEVVRRLITPLIQNQAYPWGIQLFVLNGRGYAKRLFDHFHLSLDPEVVDCWQFIHEPDAVAEYREDVDRYCEIHIVVLRIRQMFEYAWPGVGEDPNADLGWWTSRSIEANKRRNERVKAFPDSSRQPASVDMFSEERLNIMHTLNRLAVPVPIAFTLWGWGSVAAAVAQPEAAPVALLDSDGMMTPAALLQWRKQLEAADGPKNNNRWPLLHVQSLAAWLRRECAENGESGALMRIAKQFGYPRSNKLCDVLNGKGFNHKTGEELEPKLEPKLETVWPASNRGSNKTGT